MRLVYLSPVPWESFAQRPHKFVEWFHGQTGGSVLWVAPYPTRFPNWNDLRRACSPVSGRQHSSTSPTWLTVLKPRALPIEPLPGSGWVNGQLWQRQLQQITDFASQSKTWLAIGKPSVLALELLKLLPHCPSLYDAMDEFPAFYAGVSRLALAQRERLIAQRVDVISASSTELRSRWGRIHKDVRLVHNGLDLAVVPPLEREHVSTEKKVFGYVGTIASWFDWAWVYALAKARPNDEIRLIGPVFHPPNGKLPGNVKLLPACDHPAALKAMTQFQVGLIPFKKNELTASVDPIKYYEYRALGLPVISTDFGEMRFRSGERGVFITQVESDVSAMAELALQFTGDAGADQAFGQENTWETRFDAARLLP
ncbi:MAG: glycosyl transferase [Proteobacteria bacterium]|nr:glycosyl transferase [Pseudomonadota bacterium]